MVSCVSTLHFSLIIQTITLPLYPPLVSLFPNKLRLTQVHLFVEWSCFMHGWRKQVICNPATGEFRTLPRVFLKEKNLLAKSNYRDTIPKEKIVGMYLGYDPKGKEFKVLCMTASLRYGVRDNTHRVLTLGPGKRFWRPVEPKFSLVKNRNIIGDICINGVLYFGAWFEQYSTIVCFDVGSEKFRFIYTNEDHEDSYFIPGNLTLFNYKGKLALQEDSSQDGLMFWVLEDAETHEWSKHIYELSALEKDMIRYTMFVGMTGTVELFEKSIFRDFSIVLHRFRPV
ncbi:unnamed protein product [Brassica oleracea]